MTPRALLTAIGAAAGSVSNQATPVVANAASTQTTITAQPAGALYTLAANRDCPVAF